MSGQASGFKEKFDPGKWSDIYDSSRKSNKDFTFKHGNELVEDICSRVSRPNELWLDIGCGTGYLSARLSEMGLSVIGVDHDIEMIEFANERFLDHRMTNRPVFITAKADSLPFDDDTTDGVVAVSLAGCLSSPDEFFREAHRVLRKNGFAIITFTNRASLLIKINWCLNKASYMIRRPAHSDGQYRVYACAEVVDKLEKAGLRVIDVRFYNFFLNVGDLMIPPKPLAIYCERLNKYNISHRLGGNFIVVAHKI
ncbi:MAG TPA: methyltransferase domain-containing protein [Thermodesulfobacteriota bacterium]|nr:methyltransferase domain-containing protein [Thermodesulfobacteriota bacterium]